MILTVAKQQHTESHECYVAHIRSVLHESLIVTVVIDTIIVF